MYTVSEFNEIGREINDLLYLKTSPIAINFSTARMKFLRAAMFPPRTEMSVPLCVRHLLRCAATAAPW